MDENHIFQKYVQTPRLFIHLISNKGLNVPKNDIKNYFSCKNNAFWHYKLVSPGNNFNLVPITVRAKVCEDPGTGHPTGWFCLCRIR